MSSIVIKGEPSPALAPGQGPDGLPIPQQPATTTPPEGVDKALADTKAELTRAQQELAELRKQASPKPTETAPATTETPAAPVAQTPEGTVLGITEAQVEQVQAVDFSEAQAEFTQTLDLSEESRAAVAEKIKGIFGEQARSIVDDYVEGAKVRTQNIITDIVTEAGGKESYQTMVEWARDNLSQAEKLAFNEAVNSKNVASAKFAVAGLRQRFEAANGRTPNLIAGTGVSSSAPKPYASVTEMRTDMASKEYKSDPAFREKVKARLLISDIL